ncbi:hydroxyacylglutathione hydrolase [Marinobacter sp. X15-166B]|uniref:hydroxyacylglutathione hydrolase n=1 Tax=Marinobacter sp. X15-166B TaxID=1897620 RepID=UPI00085BC89F|nr:hydroxyacylglutathione hydrolase [Marinobacter sp. X15-166B]OEY67688.1 hydroxyacylglutathione hydrolase [Marinobacter sp. X15-166B]
MLTITPIPAFKDNYIWCLSQGESRRALVVDPGQSEQVIQHLAEHDLILDTILITHHHPDHTGGVQALVAALSPERVVGPADSPFTGIDTPVRSGDTLDWHGMSFRVMAVPGHTLDHIAFYSDQKVADRPVLFCGDTLFICGCGRLFEGTPAQMRQSLSKLRDLPDETAVYCTHEYTLANLKFARHWLPDDAALAEFEAECIALRDRHLPTVPGVLGREKRLNPFLRWDDDAVIEAAKAYGAKHQLTVDSADSVLAAVRHGKDQF